MSKEKNIPYSNEIERAAYLLSLNNKESKKNKRTRTKRKKTKKKKTRRGKTKKIMNKRTNKRTNRKTKSTKIKRTNRKTKRKKKTNKRKYKKQYGGNRTVSVEETQLYEDDGKTLMGVFDNSKFYSVWKITIQEDGEEIIICGRYSDLASINLRKISLLRQWYFPSKVQPPLFFRQEARVLQDRQEKMEGYFKTMSNKNDLRAWKEFSKTQPCIQSKKLFDYVHTKSTILSSMKSIGIKSYGHFIRLYSNIAYAKQGKLRKALSDTAAPPPPGAAPLPPGAGVSDTWAGAAPVGSTPPEFVAAASGGAEPAVDAVSETEITEITEFKRVRIEGLKAAITAEGPPATPPITQFNQLLEQLITMIPFKYVVLQLSTSENQISNQVECYLTHGGFIIIGNEVIEIENIVDVQVDRKYGQFTLSIIIGEREIQYCFKPENFKPGNFTEAAIWMKEFARLKEIKAVPRGEVMWGQLIERLDGLVMEHSRYSSEVDGITEMRNYKTWKIPGTETGNEPGTMGANAVEKALHEAMYPKWNIGDDIYYSHPIYKREIKAEVIETGLERGKIKIKYLSDPRQVHTETEEIIDPASEAGKLSKTPLKYIL